MYKIKFKIKNEYNKYLNIILNNIDLDNYKWVLFDDEVLDNKGNDYFKKDCYLNKEFKNIIKNNNYYIIFLGLKLYNCDEQIDETNNYNDFINSNSRLILFITDSEYVEIYVKDEENKKTILDNIKNNDILDIEIIHNPKNTRKCFSPYFD